MPIFNNPFPSASSSYVIGNSCRFNDNDSAYLSRTFGSAGDTQIISMSYWVKRSNITQYASILHSSDSSEYLRFEPDDTFDNVFNGSVTNRSSTALFRDPTAWYNMLHVVDSTQADAEDRIRMWVNGVQTTLTGGNLPLNDTFSTMNKAAAHYIARHHTAIRYFDGYLSEVIYTDGIALSPTDVGEFDTNGNWVPIDPSAGFQQHTFLTGESATFGDITGGAGVAGCFNDAAGNSYVSPDNNWYAGQDWGSGVTKTPIRCIYEASNVSDIAGGSHNSDLTLTVYGSNSSPSNGTDGTSLGSVTVTNPSNGHSNSERITIDGLTATTAYRYHWVYALDTGSNNDSMYCGELRFYEDGGLGFGTNGFWLDFADANELGKDVSGGAYTDTTTAFRYYRLNCTLNNGDASFTAISNLEIIADDSVLHPTSAMTSNSAPSPLVASASSENDASQAAWHGFNNSAAGDTWIAAGATGWLQIDLGSGNDIVPIGYKVQSATSSGRNIKEWTLSGSATGSFAGEETVIDTRTDGSTATSTEITYGLNGTNEGNNWTSSGLDSTDQTTDSPTDDANNDVGNYCTWSSVDYDAVDKPTLANGNLEATGDATGNYAGARGTIAVNSGKFAFETTNSGAATNGALIGITRTTDIKDPTTAAASLGVFYRTDNGGQIYSDGTAVQSTLGAGTADGKVVRVEIDFTNGTADFFLDNVALGSQVTGLTLDADDWVFTYMPYSATKVLADFGQLGWTNAPTSGYLPLHTDNLPAPDVAGPGSAFVTSVDTEDNIVATQATARTAMSNYIDFYRNLDTAEGWLMRFSDDSSNHLILSTTAASAAFPSFSGSNEWEAWSIEISANNGVATGTVAHTNGDGDTTVSHGLGAGEKLVIVKASSTTGDWTIRNPNVNASGESHRINSHLAESSTYYYAEVDDTNVTIQSAAPSATYRWIVLRHTPGVVFVAGYVGNGSAAGPFIYLDQTPLWSYLKCVDVGDHAEYHSVAASIKEAGTGGNSLDDTATIGAATTTGGTSDIDYLAGAIKIRTTNGRYNTSTKAALAWGFGSQPFGGSNVSQARAR